ncbi:hypothetical protein PybrP1_012926 [[Pythium] brassicae (nom. inval.)]|nr:hypothetical protein PybrP1_012926 [[Pythium] brassicae (nom. inval.)]
MNSGMMGIAISRADARAFSGKAKDDTRVALSSLPLPKRYFPKVRLSAAMLREYQATARALLDDALEQHRRERIYGGLDEVTWQNIGTSNGFQRFTKTEGDESHYRVQGAVRASLAGLMKVLFAENDRRLAERRKSLFNDFLDTQTLCVLKERSASENEHMAIRWIATELSSSSDMNRRDMCVLEFTGTTVDRDNQPIGFLISHSIQLSECKSLKQTHGLLRRVGTEVLLVYSLPDKGHSEVVLIGSSDSASEVGSWLMSSYTSRIATALSKLAVVVQERCLAHMPMIVKSEWVAASDRKSCNVCTSKFGYLSKKHHCRACGEVVCKSCIVTRLVGEESKFCKKCIILATNHDNEVSADNSDASSLVSRTSVSSATSTTSSTASSSSFHPTTPSTIKFHVNMKLLDDPRRDNSFATTENSYDSSASSSSYLDNQSFDSARIVSSLDEDSVMFVDTRAMRRQFETLNVEGTSSSRGHNSVRGRSQPQSQPVPIYSSHSSYSQPKQNQLQSQQLQERSNQPGYGFSGSQSAPLSTASSYGQTSYGQPSYTGSQSSSDYSQSVYSSAPHPSYNTSRSHGAPQMYTVPSAPSTPIGASSTTAAPANFQFMENSIAHQRHLLEKMMNQARYQSTQAYP